MDMSTEEERLAQANEKKKLGVDCCAEGDFENALVHFTDAIALDPFNYTLFANRCEIVSGSVLI